MKEYKVTVDHKGTTSWYNLKGRRHRLGGLPAIERADGSKEYWVKGERMTEQHAKELAQSCSGKVIEIDGKKYKLIED